MSQTNFATNSATDLANNPETNSENTLEGETKSISQDLIAKNQTPKKLKIPKKYILLDSAGIRKPGSRTSGAESFATFHTIEAAHQADVICLVVDGSNPLTHQDQVVAGICKEAKKGVVVIANKADLVDKIGRKLFEECFYKKFGFLKVQKFLWVSAKAEIIANNDKKSQTESQNEANHTEILGSKQNLANLEILENENTLNSQNSAKNSSESLQASINSDSNSKSQTENYLEKSQNETDKLKKYELKKAQKELRKNTLSGRNIAKMQAEFAKNLTDEKLGEFKPENGLASVWRSIDEALESRQKDLDPEQVRKLFNYLMKHRDKRPVKLQSQKKPVVYDFLYTKNSPPTFELLVKDKSAIHWSYLRFLENVVRRQFGFRNTGIIIKLVEVKKSKVMT